MYALSYICRSVFVTLVAYSFTGSILSAAELYFRGALFVVEPADSGTASEADKRKAGVDSFTIRTYAPTIAPAIGKTLRFFADANQPAAILVAAFDRKTGLLRAGLLPLLSEQDEGFEALEFPASSSGFSFEDDSPIELYVAVLALDDPELPKIRKLVAEICAMAGKPQSDDSSIFLTQRGEQMRNLLDSWVRRANSAELVVRMKEPATAGLMRGSVIRWQEYATRFDIDGKVPEVRIFPIGPSDS